MDRRLLYWRGMRSISPSIVITALASLSLASACGSKSSDKKNEQAKTTAAAAGDEAAGGEGARPAVPPVPRRVRSTDPAAAEQTGEQPLGPMGHPAAAETDEQRMERRAAMRERFAEQRAKHDKDGDGELGPEERMAMRDEMMGLRLKSIDKDGDGAISREEARAEPGRRALLRDFEVADANQDQKVTREELEAHIAERRANRRDEGGRRRPTP